jgi:hypothetical protein
MTPLTPVRGDGRLRPGASVRKAEGLERSLPALERGAPQPHDVPR